MPEKEKIILVWLKRDLRLYDHYPLHETALECQAGVKALPFYCIESDYWKTDKASPRHKDLVLASLASFGRTLQDACGAKLLVWERPSAVEALGELSEIYDITAIHSHQETSNLWTFQRDEAVFEAASKKGIHIKLWRQNGVHRAWTPANWSDWWGAWVDTPCAPAPSFWKNPDQIPPSDPWTPPAIIHSEEQADATLLSFLSNRCVRGEGYRKGMGSAGPAAELCSRISSHITWGLISSRHARQTASAILQTLPQHSPKREHIRSFMTRLSWRDHFIQQFESCYQLEFKCGNPATENLRSDNPEILERFTTGMTGYPYVDACIRSLNETGWLTFRARAMIVSFAAYALNLDWRVFGPHLAQQFIDYEPGIHYCQLQMQSGTLWKSAPRIYNPVKQSIEKDPNGEFIKAWIPELKDAPLHSIHVPGETSRHGYPSATVLPNRLWAVMRGNGPKKAAAKKDDGQLKFPI